MDANSDGDIRSVGKNSEDMEKTLDEAFAMDSYNLVRSTSSAEFDEEATIRYVHETDLRSVENMEFVTFMNRLAERMHFVVLLDNKDDCRKISERIWVGHCSHFKSLAARGALYSLFCSFQQHEGLVTLNKREILPYSAILVEDDADVRNYLRDVFKVSYIDDCINEGKVLNITKYLYVSYVRRIFRFLIVFIIMNVFLGNLNPDNLRKTSITWRLFITRRIRGIVCLKSLGKYSRNVLERRAMRGT